MQYLLLSTVDSLALILKRLHNTLRQSGECWFWYFSPNKLNSLRTALYNNHSVTVCLPCSKCVPQEHFSSSKVLLAAKLRSVIDKCWLGVTASRILIFFQQSSVTHHMIRHSRANRLAHSTFESLKTFSSVYCGLLLYRSLVLWRVLFLSKYD